MTASFYSLNKRENSTKQPTSTGTDLTITLKQGTDIDSPTFILSTNPMSFNYLSWDGNYYFIRSKRYIHNQTFEIDCEIDVLATYKASIKSSTQYILRTSVGSLADYNLIDNLYPTKGTPTVYHSSYTPGTDVTGHYVLMTISGSGIVYYALLPSDFQSFLTNIYMQDQDSLWSTIEGAGSSMVRNFLNVDQYIIGCKWVPYPKVTTGSTRELKLGYWGTGDYYTEYFNFTSLTNNTKTITLHPTTEASKAFMNCSAYHSLQIYIPGCGSYAVDYAKLKGANSCKVTYKVDVLGNITGKILNSDDDVLTVISGSLGQDVPVSSRSVNAVAVAGGIGNVISGIATGDLGQIVSGAQAAVPDVNTKGAVSSYNYEDDYLNIHAVESVYDISPQSPAIQGYPSMKTSTLSSDGYYLIKDAQVDFAADLDEKQKLVSFMEGGFYIE